MTNITKLVEANHQCLSQLLSVVQGLSPDQYRQVQVVSGTGAHVRHIIEHYDIFLKSLSSGTVIYDIRERDRTCEINQLIAVKKITLIKDTLSLLSQKNTSQPLLLNACIDGKNNHIAVNIKTSVERELLFVHQHAIHHCAQIKLLLNASKIKCEEEFGLAPATLKFNIESATE